MHRLAIRPLANARFAHATSSLHRPSRLLSTAPPHRKSRSWKSSFLRWGLAGGIVYYYNTSDFFANDPQYVTQPIVEPIRAIAQQPNTKTADAGPARRRDDSDVNANDAAPATAVDQPLPGSPEQLEAEAGQQGAFNEETGEINWDCPCLGGMAYGPCGEQFRAAFSCFVFSKEDPKGIECIDHFKTMQNCFREHPEIYGSELEEDEVADAIDGETPSASTPDQDDKDSSREHTDGGRSDGRADAKKDAQPDTSTARGRAQAATEQVAKDFKAGDDKDELVPRAAHDAR